MPSTTTTAWLDEAWRHIGVAEVVGTRADPRILAFYADAGHASIRSDDIAWCAAFVGACLTRTGYQPTRSLRARSYVDWGTPIDVAVTGAIAVFSRGSNAALGHVGFVVGSTDTDFLILGGNQTDAVTVAPYPRERLLALRWPSSHAPAPATDHTPPPSRPLFDVILDHVLAMEGGYTDDAHDPGGPTNRGITLATYAAWRRIDVTPDTFASLKAELRTLSRDTATAIYRTRYWVASKAEQMPPPLALMHVDATVNHGVTGAARLLQQVLGLPVDALLSPATLAAANAAPLASLIAAYADARIIKYRSLPHFWRFGRGWLARVEKTRAASLTLLTASPQPKDNSMTTVSPPVAPKWWGNSLTIWGTLITALATVLPAIAPLFGIDLTGEMIINFGHATTALLQAVSGVVGTIMAIVGRVRATQPLMRRPVALRL